MKIVKKEDLNELKKDEFVLVVSPYEPVFIEKYDCDGESEDVTQCIPGLKLEDGEIALSHDLVACNREWVDGFIEQLGETSRTVEFGLFDTKTTVVKLKEGWKESCFTWDEIYGEE